MGVRLIQLCVCVYIYIYVCNTVPCRYNAVNFLQDIHKRHPAPRPTGRGVGCLLWVFSLWLIFCLQWCVQYRYFGPRYGGLDCDLYWMCIGTILDNMNVYEYICMCGHDTMYWLIKNGLFGMNNGNLELYNRWIVIVWTHWGLDKMAAISQTTVSNSFSWMKIYEFRIKCHWSLFLRVQQTLFQHGSDNGLVSTRRQVIIWTHGGKITDAIIRHSASMS